MSNVTTYTPDTEINLRRNDPRGEWRGVVLRPDGTVAYRLQPTHSKQGALADATRRCAILNGQKAPEQAPVAGPDVEMGM